MKVHAFLDTNVLLDFFLGREPHGYAATQILDACVRGQIKASTSAVSFCNIAYILGRLDRKRIIEKDLEFVLVHVGIVPNTADMLSKALQFTTPDYEDAVQYASALAGKCTHLVTANKKHFRHAAIRIVDASEFVKTGWGN